MHILLPPSETKRVGGTGILNSASLRDADILHSARAAVRTALESLSADPEAAAKALGLGVKNRAELEYNHRLGDSGVLPAGERYTGVLYDTLDVESLDPAARAWFDDHVSVQSALFGLISVADEIPAYRLSAGSRLPALAGSTKAVWQAAHANIDWAGFGWILDLRSKDYARLAPLPEGAGSSLHVAQRSAAGEVRALNHFNKAAKGDLVRRLALSQAQIGCEEELIEWASGEQIELSRGGEHHQLTLVTELGAPSLSARGNQAALAR
ncbi:peroxide stress protein YaaA [Leucobacter insecticola]|uniref:Peroxide stress protein YaaA n=1 Tax=Leucobacter insecticola TaxID=2714934 RepID=A0A6G8FL31_9MICO|nr:peroxide stress protein YaaA [Leucobacter insecticola]QIM17061.1 peroxide stress protein YaaA [Leucobacter insecticola]